MTLRCPVCKYNLTSYTADVARCSRCVQYYHVQVALQPVTQGEAEDAVRTSRHQDATTRKAARA